MSKDLQNICGRNLALRVLKSLDAKNTIQAVLHEHIVVHAPEAKEVSLCTEIVYGYLRYALRIEYILDSLLKKRKKLPIELQYILGIATYEILFLDKIPHHASVNFAVSKTKNLFGHSLSKVCNGVLRSLIRLDDAPMQADFYSSQHQYYSINEWMYTTLHRAYGLENTKKILERFLQRPRVSFRLNSLYSEFSQLKQCCSLEKKLMPIGKYGFVILDGGSTNFMVHGKSLAQWHNLGALSFQAAGSQEVMHQCLLAVPELTCAPIWDACAGQGGKTLFLLEHGVAVNLVSDTSTKRIVQFTKNCLRLQHTLPATCMMSAAAPALKKWHGNILLDVPCSGFGTIARRPEIRTRRTQKEIDDLCILQKAILEKAFSCLLQNQYIIYMTCTLNPSENEYIVEDFLQKYSNAKSVFSWQTPHDHAFLEGMYVNIIKKYA